MKEIKAYIQKHKISEVTRALRRVQGLTGMSIIDTCGYGIGWNNENGEEDQPDCRPGIKIEIVCLDDLVEKVISTIKAAAHTGLKGDGRIYVSEIIQAVRISSGDTGEEAV